jgi:hypothetical protein
VRSLLVVLLALTIVPTAAAAVFSVTLNTASPVTAPGVTLNGIDQTQTFPVSITVSDPSPAAGNGWNVSMAATAPTNGANVLPALVVTTVATPGCSGGGCVTAINAITWPVTLTVGGVKIYNATVGTGTKTTALTPTVQISYPANALPLTYSSTLTVTGINNGP